MSYFYDTCSALNHYKEIFDEPFYISAVTLQEIEHIKTSFNKDSETKYKARRLANLLVEHEEMYTVIPYTPAVRETREKYLDFLEDNNDGKIIATACQYISAYNYTFVTEDVCCYHLARLAGLHPEIKRQKEDTYSGFKILTLKEDDLAKFYETLNEGSETYDLLLNEYLILADPDSGELIDQYKLTENGLKPVQFATFHSQMFGVTKPKDVFQRCAMDSLRNNQVTLIGGKPGSGKSMLALAYLFEQLEKGSLDRIVIFCNPVGAKNCAKLGFYPGSVLEKVLSTQAGHVLASKLGSEMEVERLISENKLEIIPAVDARGYEIPPHCGCYILEAQNLTSDTLRLLLQRASADTKVIVDGDRVEQLDMEIYSEDNGMKKMSQVFRGTSVYGQIDLQNIYRSEIAEIAERMKN